MQTGLVLARQYRDLHSYSHLAQSGKQGVERTGLKVTKVT